MADVFAGNVMDLCCYCGKEFEKKEKGYQRSSLSSNIRVRQFEKSLKEVIEEEFGVTLTPEQKTKHFLCSTCSSLLMTLGRSNVVTDNVIIFCRSKKKRFFTFFISLEKHLKLNIS